MTKADHVSVQTWKYFYGDTPVIALRRLADAIEGVAQMDDWALEGSISLSYSEGSEHWIAGACFKYEGAKT